MSGTRITAMAAIILMGLAFSMWAGDALRADVERTLSHMGYIQPRVEPSPATWFCAKGRFTYRFEAERDGQRVTGHACAGGFLGVAVNEDAR